MDQCPRGVIRDRDAGSQIIDFSGLTLGTITPTDVDGWIEYHDRGHFAMEFKYRLTQMPLGQKLALLRICDDLALVKPHTMLVIASHDTPPPHDINAAEAVVTHYRYRRQWHTPREPITVRQALDRWRAELDAL